MVLHPLIQLKFLINVFTPLLSLSYNKHTTLGVIFRIYILQVTANHILMIN